MGMFRIGAAPSRKVKGSVRTHHDVRRPEGVSGSGFHEVEAFELEI